MKWEYKLMDVNKSQVTEAGLNNLGEAGWELIAYEMYNNEGKIHALFKRRIE